MWGTPRSVEQGWASILFRHFKDTFGVTVSSIPLARVGECKADNLALLKEVMGPCDHEGGTPCSPLQPRLGLSFHQNIYA